MLTVTDPDAVVSCFAPEPVPASVERTAPCHVSVPCTMVRFLQAMAEDGHGAQPWRLGPGCSAQHVTQLSLSL